MNEALFWKAVRENDKRFDGLFITGVMTTGIFCRPSCPARLPKRENVVFFDDWKSAEKEGLRACLRCRPKDSGTVDPKVEAAVKACGIIDKNETADLKMLGGELNRSPAYVQKVFKEVIGVSPKKYADFRRLGEFKNGVRAGKDIVEAMYDAGFESSSRLYQDSNKKIGMTPGIYKKGGTGVTINYSVSNCGLGKLLVAATGRGICAVKIGDKSEKLVDELFEEFPNASLGEDPAILKHFVDAIVEALEGKRKILDLPVDIKATSFQMQVWEELRKIPFGETITYAELARRIGNEKSVRAVAGACAKNRVAIVIPCHRVIGSNGKLTGYRWGIELKRKILEAENPRKFSSPRLFT